MSRASPAVGQNMPASHRTQDRLGSPPAVRWTERWPRRGWDLQFTTLGGSLRSHDVLSSATAPQREALARAVSQVCLASTARPAVHNREIDFWATICRKILQRGRRPPVSSRVEHIIGERSGGQAAPPDALVAAAWGRTAPFALADSYDELDRQWEFPFWEAAKRLHPAAAAWLVPQAPLEALVGDQARDARDGGWISSSAHLGALPSSSR